LTQKLHPDNLVGDKEAQDQAGKKLSQMNEIYSNVFRRKETRDIYDRLCAYRFEYGKLVSIQDTAKLQLGTFTSPSPFLSAPSYLFLLGANNLATLKKQIKAANLPRELVEELELALDIIKQCRNVVAAST